MKIENASYYHSLSLYIRVNAYPSYVLVTSEEPKLPFGVALATDPGAASGRRTGKMLEKPAYASNPTKPGQGHPFEILC